MSNEERRYIARASADAEAQLAGFRRRFALEVQKVIGEFVKKGAYGGSAHREIIHGVCAAELRSRTGQLYLAMLECTVGAYAAPTNELRRAAKDRIAKAISTEAQELERFLWKPRAAFGESGEPDTLAEDVRREQDAIFARIDTAFDRLQHAKTERALRAVSRWTVRVARLFKFGH